MLTIKDWLRQNSHANNPNKQPRNPSDLRQLLGFLLSKNSAWLFSSPEFELSNTQVKQLDQWLKLLNDDYPLAYITGVKSFWNLNLKVNHSTLVPRADTEILIETVTDVFAENHPEYILDLGTGSGALALVLAKIFPKSKVTAVDQSVAALDVAIHNADVNQINNIEFYQSNWLENVAPEKYHLIISNPPYIDAEDPHLAALKHEPKKALIADCNGLGDFIRICDKAPAYLHDSGVLMFEHGWQQKQQVQDIMQAAGFTNISSRKDLAGHDRVTLGFNSSHTAIT